MSSNGDPEPGAGGDTIFKDLLDHAVDAVWIVDEAGVLEYVNPAAAALTGHPLEELIGRPLSLLVPADVAADYAGYSQGGRPGDLAALGAPHEIALRPRSGEPIPVELRAFEVKPLGGRRRFGGIVRDIRERKRLERERDLLVERLAHLALADELTGLPNRRAFFDALERLVAAMQRRGSHAAVAILDIDEFKRINDTFGHAAGDEVLRTVARVCARNLRQEDVIARIGGDEFAVQLPDLTAAEAAEIVERVRARLEETPIAVGGRMVTVTVSAGVSEIDPAAATMVSIMRADALLYEAKCAGRNRVAAGAPLPTSARRGPLR
jgi:diguanylate cyclase (GGDEF)-like protein/PAS domain S-box-containing protein